MQFANEVKVLMKLRISFTYIVDSRNKSIYHISIWVTHLKCPMFLVSYVAQTSTFCQWGKTPKEVIYLSLSESLLKLKGCGLKPSLDITLKERYVQGGYEVDLCTTDPKINMGHLLIWATVLPHLRIDGLCML